MEAKENTIKVNLSHWLAEKSHPETFRWFNGEKEIEFFKVRIELRESLKMLSGLFLMRPSKQYDEDKAVLKALGLAIERTFKFERLQK